ncbi:serine/threonine-protein kinase [Streptomyces sp. NPDC091377]|uniref:serine/threonine-protein kinase n=1 Tax=Streptomyces sp. NPDC091377 TaxID=3365995 RepID=UPI0038012FCB
MQPLGADEPTTLGPYRLLGRLGAGGMGRVYLGRSTGGRTVAVKIVHPHFALDEEFRARFRREVEAARRVGAAWTAPVLDADPEAPVPWVATAYAAGPSLTAAVADGGPLPAHSVRALGAGLAEALTAVHELGLVHRDVKPSNVLLTLDGPLLIDFGIARATDGTASLTSTGVSVGSPGYMAPEQILGRGVTGAADVFSLGAVLAYAATGEPPFPGDSSAALLYKVVHEEPRLTGLDGELRELVADCLAKEPSARPTPAAVAARLAPDGAARLVAGGWLPGPLVERVSRSAVALLNLETTQDALPSGPVGFSSPAVPGEGFGPAPVMPPAAPLPTQAAGTGGTAGVAGVAGTAGKAGTAPAGQATPHDPPHPTPLPTPHDDPHRLPTATPHDDPHRLPTATPHDDPHRLPTATPHDDPHRLTTATSHPRPPGRLSVSVAAGSTAGEGGRGRRLSCTVALAVAGALAAVTVGSVFVLDLLPRDGSSASGRPESGRSPSAGDGESRAAVPERFLGTWEGQGSAGPLPMGTFRVTVRQTATGGTLGEVRHTDILGSLVCVDELTLEQATDSLLVTRAEGAGDNPGNCVRTPHTVRLTPVGDDLDYQSDSVGSGKPNARLSKVD